MIATDDLPNWTRWDAKERSGINRGYAQAYRNTSRADHFVLLNARELAYDNTYKVTVKPYTNGDWKPDWSSDESKTFEGPIGDEDAILADAEAYARDWMSDHPCEREGARDAVELLTDIISALGEEGLVMQHDASLDGWTPPGHLNATSQNVRPFIYDETENALNKADDPRDADVLRIGLRLDGKLSGLSYSERTEYDSDGESRRHHEPRNQSRLHAPIERAFRAVGFEDIVVKNGGYQTHWDADVGYSVTAFIPDGFDLDRPAPDRIDRRPGLFG